MLKILQLRVTCTCAFRKSCDCPRQKNYILFIIQGTSETDIWLRTRSNLSANVPVEISRLYSTGKMISTFHEKTQVKSTVSTTSRRDLIFVIPEGVCNLIQYVIQ